MGLVYKHLSNISDYDCAHWLSTVRKLPTLRMKLT
jgi:hypothetical protein